MSDSTKPVGKSSSSPVGSSQSVSGQQNNSSNDPFPPKPFGTPTPLGSQTGNSAVFRSTPSKASPCGSATQPPQPTFGSNTQQSKPAFGSSIFDFPTPFFASSQLAFGSTSTPAFSAASTPAFGSTSTPAFGAKSTPAFGSTGTPAFGATSTPAFGATSTPAFGSTSTPAFGATSTPAFGSMGTPAFGSTSTPAFGSMSTPAFGATSTPAFGATSTPAFGSTGTPAFGATSTPAFGSTSTPAYGATTPAFSFGSSTQAFCQSSSAFGSQTANQTFEDTSIGQSEFGGQRGGSETDGGSFHILLSTMSVYKDKSHEELRWEDYQLGTKAFGQSSSRPFGFSHSLFGQKNNSSNNPSGSKPLGLQTGNSSTSAGVFGATQTLSPFSSNTTSSASSSPAFNSSMPASGASSTPAFGNSSALFGLSVFGLMPAFGGFRSTPTQTSPFGSAVQPPQPTFGSNTQQSQPSFGSTSTPAFGATTLAFSFGSSTQALGQFSSAFGTSSPFGSTTSAFGGSQTPTQTFENTGLRGGSRIASYSATTETDGGSRQTENLVSISTMSVYKDKSHEELRWEDYQLGDKGGPLTSAPQSTGMGGFNSSTTQTNAFSPSPIFGQSSANPFSSTTTDSTSPAFPLLQSNVPWLKDICQRVIGTANFGAVSQLNIADRYRLFTEIFSQVIDGLLFSGALIHDGGILSGTSVDELSSLRARVKHLEGESEKTLLREETLKKEVKAMGELKRELSMANEDLANARKKITALGEQNGSLTEKVTTLDAQNEILSEKVKTLEEHKKSLSEKIRSIELVIAEHGDPAVLKKELAEARDALASKDTTSLDKDEELVNLRNVKASLEKELYESLDNGTDVAKVVFEDALRQVEKGLSVELDRSIYKLDKGKNGGEDELPVAEGEDGA